MRKTLLVPALVLLAGCSFHAVGPIPPGMAEDKYSALQLFAGRNLNCGVEKLTYESFGKHRHVFKGCDEEMEMIVFEGADAEAYGFTRGFVEPAATNRFAKEVGCKLRETTEERIDYRTHIVDGCGKRITYSNVCDARGCAWTPEVLATKH